MRQNRKQEQKQAQYQLKQFKKQANTPGFIFTPTPISFKPSRANLLMWFLLMSTQVSEIHADDRYPQWEQKNNHDPLDPNMCATPSIEPQILKNICTNITLPTYNRWKGTRLYVDQNNLTSIDCYNKNRFFSHSCLLERNHPKPDRHPVLEQQSQVRFHQGLRESREWDNRFLAKFNKSFPVPLSKSQEKMFENIYNQLSTLARYKGMQRYGEKMGGVCIEHTAIAILKLLRAKQEHQLDIVITYIHLQGVNPNGQVRTHAFSLIEKGSNRNAGYKIITIENNAEQVADYMREKMEAGAIVCDPWNAGTFGRLEDDITSVYKSFFWKTLSAGVASVHFDGFKKLSDKLQLFICKELTELQLMIEPPSDCMTNEPNIHRMN